MAQKISVAIIGLGRSGASVGLALQRYNRKKDAAYQFDLIGLDNRPDVLHEAEKMGVVSKTTLNTHSAVQERDIIVLALPYADLRRTYQAMRETLRPGAVIMDMSPLKMPSIAYAADYLPDEAHLVGLSPVINPRYLFDGLDDTEHAAEDYFDKSNMMILPAARCAPEAVDLASNFAALLGATPHFMDPLEHDSLVAASLGLPTLLGVLSFYTLSRSPGWGDMQRLTNPPFARLTHQLFDTHPDDLRDLWIGSRESLIQYLDSFNDSLQQIRQALADEDQTSIEGMLNDASTEYSAWINRRHRNQWDEEPPKLEKPGLTDSLIGGYLGKRLRGDNNNDN